MTRAALFALTLLACGGPPPAEQEQTTPPEPTVTTTSPVSEVLETFQPVPRQADVLLVVQDSWETQDRWQSYSAWAAALPDAVDALGLDVQVGLITTDPARGGRLRSGGPYRWLTNAELPTHLEALTTLAIPTTSLDVGGPEQVLDAWASGIMGYNAGFFRENADLHVIFVAETGTLGTADFPSWRMNAKSAPWTVTSSAVVPPGAELEALVTPDGALVDIDDADWSATWDVLDTPDPVRDDRLLVLEGDPEPATIDVWAEVAGALSPMAQGTDWIWDEAQGAVVISTESQVDPPGAYRVRYLPAGSDPSDLDPATPQFPALEDLSVVAVPPPLGDPDASYQPPTGPPYSYPAWDTCDWAFHVALFLDHLADPATDTMRFCHSASCNNYTEVVGDVGTCLTHIGHSCDIFPSWGC